MGSELRPLMRLAIPVILAELGWMGMGVVDTIMVGRLGAEAIGAVAIGNVIFSTIGLLCFGLLLGLDTLISQAVGARDFEDAKHWFRQGLWLAAFVSPLLLVTMWCIDPVLDSWGLDPNVLMMTKPFVFVLAISVIPLSFYTAQRRYLQSLHIVQPVTFTLISANVVNAALNWVLIPEYGVRGSAWSTVMARVYMAVALAVVLLWKDKSVFAAEWPDWPRLRELFWLGVPAAGHIFAEIAVFGAATALAGRFPAVALAAHEVTLNHAALAYMVPLGISSAAAVRVGNEIGAGEPHKAKRAGNTAIYAGAAFMSASAVVMFLFPKQILRIYTVDERVVSYAVPLLFWAAAFQLFDGIQVVSTGALRGAADTRTPLAAGLIGYWVIGLPLGAYLCFMGGMGVTGLWIGLSLGLALVAVMLLVRWLRYSG